MNQAQQPWFPNFCSLPAVFTVALVAELVAIVTVAAQHSLLNSFWEHLPLASLFVQWVALLCAGTLCAIRERLSQLSIIAGLGMAWIVVMIIATLATLAMVWIEQNLQLGLWTLQEPRRALSGQLMVVALVAAGTLRYFYVQQQWRRSVEAQAESRVRALQARIRPHFLFNSMNTIASLIRSQPEIAERTVEDLAELFRRVLNQQRQQVSLDEELRMTRRYLAIEELRLGDRLRIDWQTDALPGEQRVPPLLLQPLVENAVYHGIEPLVDGGVLCVQGQADANHWQIQISNPCAAEAQSTRQGNGIALDNIRERLQHYYADQAEMLIDATPASYTVTLRAPLRPIEE